MTSDSIIIITMHNTSTDTSTATITMLLLCVVLTSGVSMCNYRYYKYDIFTDQPVAIDSTLDVDEICAVGVPTKEYIFLTCSWHAYCH